MGPFQIKQLLVAMGLVAWQLPAGALGLLEAYEAALQNDPTYRSALRENEAGQQFKELGRANLLPTLAANYAKYRNSADITNTATPEAGTEHRRYNSVVASIQLRQPLYYPEGMARYRQGVAQTNGSNAVLATRSQELIVRVVSLYTFAKYAEDQLAQALAQREAYAEQRLSNLRLFQRGEGTRTDVLETQAKFDLSIAQVLEANDNLANARIALSAVVGREVTALDPLVDDFKAVPAASRTFEEWKTIALSSSPDLQSQRQAVEVAREEASKASAGHLPRLDLLASLAKNDSDTINTFNQNANIRSIGVQLSVPLYSGGAVTAASRQAAANYEKARADLDAKTNDVLIELRKQYNLASSSVARLDAARTAYDSALLQVDATQKSVKGGQRTNLDVLNAQRQLFEAQRDLSQARYNHLLTVLRLRSAAGLLQLADLAEVALYFRGAKATP